MYKRQNTSVAYQAPEGKTYVSDLRDVYDFHFGQSKVVKNSSDGNLMALFETTILQNIDASSSSSPEIGGITGPVSGYGASVVTGSGHPMTSSPPNGHMAHQQYHPPAFNPHRNLQQLVHPHNNQFNLFESQNPYGMAAIHYGMMATQNQQHYNPLNPALYHCHNFGNNTFNDIRNHFATNPQIATHHNQSTSNSLPHSPSTASSPHSSLNLDMDFSFDKSNHSNRTKSSTSPENSIKTLSNSPNSPPETPKSSPIRSDPEPAAVMEYLPQSTKAQLKRKRTGSELELAEAMRKIKKSRIELQKMEKKSNFHNLRNLDSQPAPNQTVTISESDPAGPFAKNRFSTTPPKPSLPPPPIAAPSSGQMKHSIRNILNLDELDNDIPPPTLDPETNPAQLKNSDVFVKGQITQKGPQMTHRQYFNPFNPSSAIHYHLPKF